MSSRLQNYYIQQQWSRLTPKFPIIIHSPPYTIQQCPPYTSHDHPPLLPPWPLDPTCHIIWHPALDKTRPTACMLYHNKARQRYSLAFLLLLTSQKNRTLAYNKTTVKSQKSFAEPECISDQDACPLHSTPVCRTALLVLWANDVEVLPLLRVIVWKMKAAYVIWNWSLRDWENAHEKVSQWNWIRCTVKSAHINLCNEQPILQHRVRFVVEVHI